MNVVRQSDVNKPLEGKIKPEDIKPQADAAKRVATQTQFLINFLNKDGCENCSYKECTMSVLPSGPLTSPFMIIADSPGPYDLYTRTPLFDAGGRLLTLTLDKLGMSRETIYMTNGIKCSCGGPVVKEAHYICFCNHIMKEIQMVRPNIVLVLGDNNSRVAQDFFVGEDPAVNRSLETLRGHSTMVDINGLKFEMYHTYDPSAVLNKVGSLYDKFKVDLWKDISRVVARAKELNPGYDFKRRE